MFLKIADKDKFLSAFLMPISKVVDNTLLKVSKGLITTTFTANSDNVVVFGEYTDPNIDAEKDLNIPDIGKLCRVISCIEQNEIELDITNNNIAYSSSNIRFKYHLFDNSLTVLPKLKFEKLVDYGFDGEFNLPLSNLQSLIRGSAIATDTNKIYITVDGTNVIAELTDKSRPNVDTYGLKISESYSGVQFTKALSFNFELFRTLSSIKGKDIEVKLITKLGLVVFTLFTENTKLKFVISALMD